MKVDHKLKRKIVGKKYLWGWWGRYTIYFCYK